MQWGTLIPQVHRPWALFYTVVIVIPLKHEVHDIALREVGVDGVLVLPAKENLVQDFLICVLREPCLVLAELLVARDRPLPLLLSHVGEVLPELHDPEVKVEEVGVDVLPLDEVLLELSPEVP